MGERVDWEEPERKTGGPWGAALVAVVLLGVGLALVITPDDRRDPDTVAVESDDEQADGDDAPPEESLPEEVLAEADPDPEPDEEVEVSVEEPSDLDRSAPSRFVFEEATVQDHAALPGSPQLTLHAFDSQGRRVHSVDLATGAVAVGNLDGPLRTITPNQPLQVLGDAVVLGLPHGYSHGTVYAYTSGLDHDPVMIGEADFVIGGDENGVWLQSFSHEGSAAPLTRVALDGDGSRTEYELPRSAWPIGVVGDRVVLTYFGSVATHHPPSGEGEVFAHGRVLTTAGQYVAWVGCEGRLDCRLHSAPGAGDGPSRSVALQDVREDLILGPPDGIRLSPDGRYLATLDAGDRRSPALAVIDLDNGDVTEIPDLPTTSLGMTGLAPAWSPDAEWLFAPSTRGGVTAWHAPSTEAYHLPFMAGAPQAIVVE